MLGTKSRPLIIDSTAPSNTLFTPIHLRFILDYKKGRVLAWKRAVWPGDSEMATL